MKYKQKENEQFDDFIPEFVNDEYFSTQSLKRAVWQYLIDHSKVVDDEGTISIRFYIPSEREFWWRVKARDEGRFLRTEMFDFQQKLHNKHKQVQQLRIIKNKYLDIVCEENRKKIAISDVLKGSNLYAKFLIIIAQKIALLSDKMIKSVIHR